MLAPKLLDTITYSEDLIIIVCDLDILAYQGNQEIAIPMIILFNDGPKTVDITIGKTSGGNARKPSDILINTSSVLLPLEIPEIRPTGTPIKTEHKTTPKATLNDDSAP